MANYQWSPDYSQVIDLDRFPGATWNQGGYQRDSDGNSFVEPAGFTVNGQPVGMLENPYSTREGGAPSYEGPDYQKLREIGLWDLSNPDSDTWKFLQAQAGGADVRNDPSALYVALGKAGVGTGLGQDRGAWEGRFREALAGVDPQFVELFVPAAGQAMQTSWDNIDDSITFKDNAKTFASLFTQTPLGIALAAFTGGASLAAGATTAGAAATAGAVTGGLQGLAQEGDLLDAAKGAVGGAVTGGALGAAGDYLFGGAAPVGSLPDMSAGMAPADLAALIESGTVGTAGAGLEGLAGIGAVSGGMTAADLAQLIESGTAGVEGAQLEGLAGIGSTAPAVAGASLATASGGGTVAPASSAQPSGLDGLTPADLGQEALPFTTDPSLADLGGVIDPATGLPLVPAGTGADVAPPGSTPPAQNPPAGNGGSSVLGRILDGTATQADWLSVLGNVGATGLSMFGLNQQQDAMNAIAQQQMAAEQARYADLVAREQERFGTLLGREDAAIGRQRGDIEFGRAQGAPYREQLAGLMADPNSFLQSAAVQAPVQQGTDALARALSVKGNPAGNPAAMAEIQKYASNSLASLLGKEKDRLATFGGLSAFNQAGATVPGIGSSLPGSATAGSNVGTSGGLSALLGGAQAGAQQWADLGRGIRNVFSLV